MFTLTKGHRRPAWRVSNKHEATTHNIMTTPQRATLLGLPRELRDQIYHAAFVTDISISFTKHGGLSNRAIFTPTKPPSGRNIPWINLMLACRTIRDDLQAYTTKSKSMQSDKCKQLRTYCLDIKFNKRDINTITWRCIPCHPSEADTIVTNATAPKEGVRFGGCGGPSQPANSLWHLLNSTLHYGPRLRAQPLVRHMQVQEVTVWISEGNENSEHRAAYGYIARMLAALAMCGVLYQYVDRFLISNERYSEEIEVVHEGAEASQELIRYGFTWGVY